MWYCLFFHLSLLFFLSPSASQPSHSRAFQSTQTTRTFSDCQLAGAFGREIRLCRVFIWMRRSHERSETPSNSINSYSTKSLFLSIVYIDIMTGANVAGSRDNGRQWGESKVWWPDFKRKVSTVCRLFWIHNTKTSSKRHTTADRG